MDSEFPLPKNTIKDIPAYSAGKKAKDYGKSAFNTVKLSSNEALWGPSEKAIDSIKRYASQIHYYPESQSYVLRELIAKLHGMEVDNVILGNGSNEVIQFVLAAYVSRNENVLIPEPTFSMYEIYSKISGIKVRTFQLDEAFDLNLNKMSSQITSSTKAVFLTSPNNPTGTIIPKMELELFLMGLRKNILVVLDEAYIDFCDSNLRPDLEDMIQSGKYPNLILLRTFSKAYGLSSLRLGYGIGSSDLIANLHKVRQPFNVNGMAIEAGIASLEHSQHYNRIVEQVRINRNFLEKELRKMEVTFLSSHANFIMIRIGDSESCCQFFAEKGIFIRGLSSFSLPEYIRVTISKREYMVLFLKVLREFLGIDDVF